MNDWRADRDAALLLLEREPQGEARAQAAELLCELAFGSPDRFEELSTSVPRLLADAQPEVRCAGLALAAQVVSSEEAEGIFGRFLADPFQRVRLEAAGRLADLARPAARGLLAAALMDESFAVRFEAARGMAAVGHQAGVEVLISALEEPELRFRALGALAELAEPSTLPAVRKVFRRWFLQAFERTQAAAALARLGDPEGATYLMARTKKRWSMDRPMAIELLGELKLPGALQRLREILADPKDSCRGAAARGLGRLRDPAGLELLERTLAASSDDELTVDLADGFLLFGSDQARAKVHEALQRAQSTEAKEEIQQLLREAE